MTKQLSDQPIIIGGSDEEDEEVDPNSMANLESEEEEIPSKQDIVVINGETFVGKVSRFTVTMDKVTKKTIVKLVLRA